MGKVQLIIAVLFLLTFSSSVFAKSIGNFKGYKQVTDKEILIETTNGSQVLFSAYNNYAIGVVTLSKEENINLTAPQSIEERTDLTGSIYVEELDDLMQITTTNNDGLVIKIEKNPLHFTFIDKTNSNVLFEEGIKFNNKGNNLDLTVEEDEELKLISSSNYESNTLDIALGEIIDYSKYNEFLYPNTEICMISSKGYALILNAKIKHEINHSKSDKLKIATKQQEKRGFEFMLVYGNQQTDLIAKYAFHSTPFDNQISLK